MYRKLSSKQISSKESVKHALKAQTSMYKIWPAVSLKCKKINPETFTSQIHVVY